jgi:hypothetical protein
MGDSHGVVRNEERTWKFVTQIYCKGWLSHSGDDLNLTIRNLWFSRFLLAATLNQGNPDRDHKLWNIGSIEIYILHMQVLLECCFIDNRILWLLVCCICSIEIQNTTNTTRSASNIDLHLIFDNGWQLRTYLYDKIDGLNFSIVNCRFIWSNIPAAPAYGVYISQLIRYSKVCGLYQDFLD